MRLARPHDHLLSDQHILDSDQLLVTVTEDGRVLRRRPSGAHGVAGAVHREVLERVGRSKEGQQDAALAPGVDNRRSSPPRTDQQVDVDNAGRGR